MVFKPRIFACFDTMLKCVSISSKNLSYWERSLLFTKLCFFDTLFFGSLINKDIKKRSQDNSLLRRSFNYFYPTSILVQSYAIIFFHVANSMIQLLKLNWGLDIFHLNFPPKWLLSATCNLIIDCLYWYPFCLHQNYKNAYLHLTTVKS